MIWVIGAVAVDLIARNPLFTPGSSTPAEIHIGVGGVGYRIFRHLNEPKKFITAVGDDLLGRWLREQLDQEAGWISLRHSSLRTGCYSAFMEQGRLLHGASDMACVEQLSWESIASVLRPDKGDILILDANLDPELVQTTLARFGSECRIVFESVSVDKLRRHWPGLRDLYLLAANQDERQELPQADEIQSQLAAKRIENLLVSRGAQGVLLFTKGRVIEFPPQRVIAAQDTTGAGDRLLAELCGLLVEGSRLIQAIPRAMEAVSRAMEENLL